MKSDISLQHNILYSRGYEKVQMTEHFFPDHALGIMLSGGSYYFINEGTFVMKEGTMALIRKNQLFKKLIHCKINIRTAGSLFINIKALGDDF
jgi:AraC family transcriptional regulator, exoenzyme S synthesis regulatory protein ExsA